MEKIRQFEIIEEGKLIFDTFLDENSVFQVNVSTNITRVIKEFLTTKEREIDVNLFQKAKHSVEWLLSDNLKRFQRKIEEENFEIVLSRKNSFVEQLTGFFRRMSSDSDLTSSIEGLSPQNSPVLRKNSTGSPGVFICTYI